MAAERFLYGIQKLSDHPRELSTMEISNFYLASDSFMILLGCSADNPDVYNDFENLSHHENEKDSYEIKRQVNNQDVLVMRFTVAV